MAKKERKLDRHQVVSLAVGALVVMLLSYLLIAHTPLRRTIPGYPSRETQQAAIENYQKIDSLEKVIDLWAFQVANIQRIATGREPLPIDSMRLEKTGTLPAEAERAAQAASDSLLRAQVAQLDSALASAPAPGRIEALDNLKFTRPPAHIPVGGVPQPAGRRDARGFQPHRQPSLHRSDGTDPYPGQRHPRRHHRIGRMERNRRLHPQNAARK